MKVWLPTMALTTVLTLSMAGTSAQATGVMGGAVTGVAGHTNARPGGRGFGFHHGFHHGFGVRSPFFHPVHPFHRSRLNFGAGFAPRQSSEVAGGFGDYDDSYDDDYDNSYVDDSISNLHFRVQEPFGPGDIGRPPARAEEDAPYIPDRMDPSYGYPPDR